jgi:EAL domain-containing protein (putative c-di-GMP-specific phosphodiesterase class I)
MEFALQERQFDIYLQPVYNSATGKIVSAEALVRWQHPSQGVVSPGRFIPVFERNGFIVRLDRYVWEMVCEFLGKLREATGVLLPVSVNVSRLNLYNLDLLDFLMGLISKHNLSPEYLHLEITEEAYTHDAHQLIDEVEMFRQNGFKVTLDDFGRGCSPLSMLKELPVDTLKVDFGFMRKGARAERGARIMGGVVEMAEDLEMDIIVEGVESQEEFEFATKKGARLIQGYYYAKPMPREAFMELCAKDFLEGK